LIDSLNEMQQKKYREIDTTKYRLPSDQYLAEAIGFDHMPDNIPFDENE
jgi:hypothetical protein